MIERLEAYLSAHPLPDGVIFRRQEGGAELEIQPRRASDLLVLILLVLLPLGMDFVIGLILRDSKQIEGKFLFSILFMNLAMLAFIVDRLDRCLRLNRRTILRIDDDLDGFRIFHRSKGGIEGPSMAFDRTCFVAVIQDETANSALPRLEIYPDAESRSKGVSPWTQKPKGSCATVYCYQNGCEWALELLKFLKRNPAKQKRYLRASLR